MKFVASHFGGRLGNTPLRCDPSRLCDPFCLLGGFRLGVPNRRYARMRYTEQFLALKFPNEV